MHRAPQVGLAFLLAFALTLLSVRVQRVGPEQAVTGHVCGPTRNDACFADVLKGGFPLAFLFDKPTISRPNQLGFGEDSFRPGAFALDVTIYLLALVLLLASVSRRRQH